MCARRIEFTGPTLRPLRKWLIGFAMLAVCAFFLALGLSRGFPGWLRDLGWALYLLILLGGSVCLLWLSLKHRRTHFGQLGFIPQSWTRWVLDKPVSAKKPGADR